MLLLSPLQLDAELVVRNGGAADALWEWNVPWLRLSLRIGAREETRCSLKEYGHFRQSRDLSVNAKSFEMACEAPAGDCSQLLVPQKQARGMGFEDVI